MVGSRIPVEKLFTGGKKNIYNKNSKTNIHYIRSESKTLLSRVKKRIIKKKKNEESILHFGLVGPV